MENQDRSVMDALISLADSGFVTINADDYGYGYQKISAAVYGFLSQMLIGFDYRSERMNNSQASFDFLKHTYHFEIPAVKDGNQRLVPLDTLKEFQKRKTILISASWGSDFKWMALALQNLLIYFHVAHEFKSDEVVVKETVYRITLLQNDKIERIVA